MFKFKCREDGSGKPQPKAAPVGADAGSFSPARGRYVRRQIGWLMVSTAFGCSFAFSALITFSQGNQIGVAFTTMAALCALKMSDAAFLIAEAFRDERSAYRSALKKSSADIVYLANQLSIERAVNCKHAAAVSAILAGEAEDGWNDWTSSADIIPFNRKPH